MKSTNYLELIFCVYGIREESQFIFIFVQVFNLAPCVKMTTLFPPRNCITSVINQEIICVIAFWKLFCFIALFVYPSINTLVLTTIVK